MTAQGIYIGYKDKPLQGHMIYPTDDIEIFYWNGEDWILLHTTTEYLFGMVDKQIVIEVSL